MEAAQQKIEEEAKVDLYIKILDTCREYCISGYSSEKLNSSEMNCVDNCVRKV